VTRHGEDLGDAMPRQAAAEYGNTFAHGSARRIAAVGIEDVTGVEI
jgi:hypothetical protein